MPEYIYQHPKTKEVKTIIQSMNEDHSYSEGGIKWNRVWSNPQLNTKGSVDPFDEKKFVEKTGNMKGTIGDMFDYSAEMSERRASKAGKDPVKEKLFKDYEKETGKKHLMDRPTKFENDLISFDAE